MTIIDDAIDGFIRLATRDLQLNKLKECSNCDDTIYWASDQCKPVYESAGKLICYTCSQDTNYIEMMKGNCRVENTFIANEFDKIIKSEDFKAFLLHYNNKYNKTSLWSKSIYEYSEENRQLISALSQEQEEKQALLNALSQEHDAKVKLEKDTCFKCNKNELDLEDYQDTYIRLSKTCKSYQETFLNVTEQNIKLEETVNKYKQEIEELNLQIASQEKNSYLSRKEEIRIQNMQHKVIIDKYKQEIEDLKLALNDQAKTASLSRKEDISIQNELAQNKLIDELEAELKDVRKTLSISNLDRSFMEESLEKAYNDIREQEFEIERLGNWLSEFEDSNTELIKVKKLLEEEKMNSAELESKLTENINKHKKLSNEWSIQYNYIKDHSIDLEQNLNKRTEQFAKNSKQLKRELGFKLIEISLLKNTINNMRKDLNNIASMKLDTSYETCLTKIEEVFKLHNKTLLDEEEVYLSTESDSESCKSFTSDDYETISNE